LRSVVMRAQQGRSRCRMSTKGADDHGIPPLKGCGDQVIPHPSNAVPHPVL
jgi:hypothetical protein